MVELQVKTASQPEKEGLTEETEKFCNDICLQKKEMEELTEVKLEVEDVQIELNLDKLAQEDGALAEIFAAGVEDLPIAVQ